jgi:hypothetical protein
MIAWLLQRQCRLSHGKMGGELVADADPHGAVPLMRVAGILCDCMNPDDDMEFPAYMNKPVP